MEIDLNHYDVINTYVNNWITKFPDRCTITDIREIAVGLSCPLIVVLYFFKYRFPERQDILEKINVIKDFYQYTNIIELKHV